MLRSQLPFGEQGDSYEEVDCTRTAIERRCLNCLSANRVIHICNHVFKRIVRVWCLNCLSANRVIHIAAAAAAWWFLKDESQLPFGEQGDSYRKEDEVAKVTEDEVSIAFRRTG